MGVTSLYGCERNSVKMLEVILVEVTFNRYFHVNLKH